MKILITGGSGFIGRNLAEQLAQRHDVFAPSHKELDLLNEDAVNRFFIQNKFDVVIYCATKPGHRNAVDTVDLVYNNLRMLVNVVRNESKFGKMIFLGTGLEYDQRYYKPKMKEEYFDTYVPKDEAGFSKYLCAKYIETSNKIINLRLFGVFGKYEDYAIRFISNAICKSLFDLPITIKQNRRFDYIYIVDLVPIINYFIDNKVHYNTYNVTPDQSIELYTLAEKVRDISRKDLPIIVAHEGIGVEYSGDNSRLRREIIDIKFTPVDIAIDKLYGWYANNRYLIDKHKLSIDK